MTAEKVKRKLTAILSADVKGYSRLMGEDEVGTIRVLQTYRGVISDLIQKKGGRVVDSPGDNVLAEFASVVDALESAVEIQRELKVRNADRSESRRMEFRIGINLGDVVEEGERIYGDGVNIAARIEGLADGGGICISGTAFDHIGKRLPLGYEYMGEQEVKNIEKLVRVYRVLMEPEQAGKVIGEKVPRRIQWLWGAAAVALLVLVVGGLVWNFYWRAPKFEPASEEKMAYPLPDKPSIAVLPFDNISGDREQDYIADGITENIISYLSKIPEMFVIDRKSTSAYKGKQLRIQQVSEDLGVQYILEGSVQKSVNKLRVTAQLVDALKGHQLWTERYDRDFQDLFALQDEITANILKAIGVQLTGERLIIQSDTTNLEAWGYANKALSLNFIGKKEAVLEARALSEKAVKLDPNYGYAWSIHAWTYIIPVLLGYADSPTDSLKRAAELAQKVEATGKAPGVFHHTMLAVYLLQGRYDEAIAEGEKAVAIVPNEADHYVFLGLALCFAGRPNEAIANTKKAMRLYPNHPTHYFVFLGRAYELAGQYSEAIAAFNKAIEHSVKGEYPIIEAHEFLAIIYARLGHMDKAKSHADELLKIDPKYTADSFRIRYPYKDPAYTDNLVSLLVKAGLPGKSPLR
jgi:adenylate cyclase